jgi:hypothetical protein
VFSGVIGRKKGRNRMKKIFVYTAILVGLTSLLCLYCTKNIAGGTEVGNPSVSAMLYEPDGKTPAVGAKVYFFRFGTDPRTGLSAAVDSAVTNTDGNYSATLDTGTYNILASKGNNATFQDSIRAIKDSTVHPPADTIEAPGSISGRVALEGTDDPRTVFVLFMGTNTFTTVVDTLGNFTQAGLAKGKYRVKLLSTLDNYKPMDTGFVVKAGVDSVILEPIRLEFTGIPVPKNLKVSYDTLKQLVTLTWDKADTALVKSYNVYRRNVDSNTVFTRINPAPVKDTVYRDSTGVQDQTYEYSIAAVNMNLTEGTKSALIVTKIVSAFELFKTIPLKGNDPFRLALSKDTLLFVAFRADTIIKVYNLNGDSIRAFGKGQFSQPYGIALNSKGNVFIADPSGKIIKFGVDGTKQSDWLINSPTDIAIDQNDQIYVLYENSIRIAKLDSLGTKQDSITLNGQVGRLILDAQGSLYIVEPTSLTVRIYDSNLALKNTLQNIPSSMLKAIDLKGNLYFQKFGTVGQSSVDYVHVLSQSGALVAVWGYFNSLTDLRILNSSIYLLNYNETPWQAQVQIFKAHF